MKYMTKGADSPDVINGKLWDCSSNLKQKHNCEMLLEDEEMKLLTRANNNLKIDRKDNEHCTMWFLTYDQLRKLATPYHMQKYEEWLNSIRNPLPKNKKETDLKTSKQLQQITEVHTQQLKSPITQQRKPDPPILPQPECPF